MRKRCLFVSPYFAPELVSTGKWNKEVCDIISSGCELTVLCLHPFYPEWRMTLEETSDLLPYKVVRPDALFSFPENNTLRRAVLEVRFAIYASRYLFSNKQKFDELILILPPSLFGLVATKIFKADDRPGKKITTIVHDLQSVHLIATDSGSRIKKFAEKMLNRLEQGVFKGSSSVVFLSNEMLGHASKFMTDDVRKKSKVLFPFVTVGQSPDTCQLGWVFNESRKSVVYSGALGEKQNPKALLEIFHRLTKLNPEVDCLVFSAGPNYELLKETYKDSRIKFHGFVDENLILEQLNRSDIQVLPQASGTSAGSVPSKLPNILYSSAKLFVITDQQSELTSLLCDVEGVVLQNDWDVDVCVERISSLVGTPIIGTENRQKLLEQFSTKRIRETLEY